MDGVIRGEILDAIRLAQRELHWRPGKATTHLAKRIDLGHLQPGTTVAEYEALIRRILHEPQADVYIFAFQEKVYPSIVSHQLDQLWLVMLDISGQMETAFVVEQPTVYLTVPRFVLLGKSGELMP